MILYTHILKHDISDIWWRIRIRSRTWSANALYSTYQRPTQKEILGSGQSSCQTKEIGDHVARWFTTPWRKRCWKLGWIGWRRRDGEQMKRCVCFDEWRLLTFWVIQQSITERPPQDIENNKLYHSIMLERWEDHIHWGDSDEDDMNW